MFNDHYFDQLPKRVELFAARTGHDAVAVVARTRWGMFNVVQVHAEEALVALVIYAGPSKSAETEGNDADIGTDEDGAAPPADPAADAEAPVQVAEIFVPYTELISVELYPGAEATRFVGGDYLDREPLIGFGRG